jgi:hypothetical protein
MLKRHRLPVLQGQVPAQAPEECQQSSFDNQQVLQQSPSCK